jgi:AcrR family transcriptional regulator
MQTELHDMSRHARRKLRTRQALKASAVALLVEKGYDALTVQDITDRLDLARATFYVHFRDKDEIVWALAQDSFAALAERLGEVNEPDAAAWHRRKLALVFSYVAEQRALFQVMLGERGHITLIRRLAATMAEIIAGDLARTAPQARAMHPLAAQFLAGAMIQTITWWLERGLPESPDVLAESFHNFERRMLHGAGGG